MKENGGKGPGQSPLTADQWTHRLALQLLNGLPEDHQHALAVLDRARFLLECWQLQPEDAGKTAEVRQLKPRLVTVD